MTSTAPRGFTLIELLIGSSILLIVVTGVYTSFSLGLQVRERCRSGAEELQAERTLASYLREDLRNLAPSRPHLAVEDGAISMLRRPRDVAGADSVRWLRVRYRAQPTPEGGRHVVREESPHRWSEESPGPRQELGYEEREGELIPVWLDDVEKSGFRSSDFPAVKELAAVAVRWEEGELSEASNGIQDSTAAIEIGFTAAAQGPGDRPVDPPAFELTVWLAPPAVARRVN